MTNVSPVLQQQDPVMKVMMHPNDHSNWRGDNNYLCKEIVVDFFYCAAPEIEVSEVPHSKTETEVPSFPASQQH